MKTKDKKKNKHRELSDVVSALVDEVGKLQEDMRVVVGTLGDLQDRFERVTDDSDEETHWLDSPVRVTAEQAQSMSDAGGWIMGWDEKGWLFIGNLERPPHDDGNGCWHDKEGNEQHGPTGF